MTNNSMLSESKKDAFWIFSLNFRSGCSIYWCKHIIILFLTNLWLACDCDSLGTLSGANTCDPISGQCNCKRYTTGRRCDMCLVRLKYDIPIIKLLTWIKFQPQTWGMSAIPQGCNECDCDVGGAYDNDCNSITGQCRCRPNINNRRCDIVVSGNFLPALDFYLFEAEDAEVVKVCFFIFFELHLFVFWK